MNPSTVMKTALFLFIVFAVAGIATMLGNIDFSTGTGIIFLVIAIIFLIVYYMFRRKAKK
jgi:Ca2+/Na+ antiporter